MMLSGLIEVTVKTKSNFSGNDVDSTNQQYKVTTQAPKYETYLMEQEVHGLKQTLEINPAQDYAHLDAKLQS